MHLRFFIERKRLTALKAQPVGCFHWGLFRLTAATAVGALRFCLKNPQGNNSLDLNLGDIVGRESSTTPLKKPLTRLKTQPIGCFHWDLFRLAAATAVEALRLCLKNPQGNNSLDLSKLLPFFLRVHCVAERIPDHVDTDYRERQKQRREQPLPPIILNHHAVVAARKHIPPGRLWRLYAKT